MKLFQRAVLTAKGFCMGLADVVPGVSGGTMALILGIYAQFIDAIKSINLRFVRPLLGWIGSGFKKARAEALREALGTIHLGFLVFLGSGIAIAFIIGSRIIPDLMEDHPLVMSAFFFGLVLASVWVPYRLMDRHGWKEATAALLAALAAFFLVGLSTEHADRWDTVQVVSRGEAVETLAETVPSAATPAQLLAMEQNRGLLEPIAAANDTSVDRLLAQASTEPEHAAKAMVVPEGLSLTVPRPPYWFVLLCGLLAICAMMLPGVSGSFVLLALGAYYFMLNALKGLIHGLTRLDVSGSHVLFVGLFLGGLVVGLVAFSRLLSFLLHRYESVTLAAMVGLMIGCLRRIWPFRDGLDDNVWPWDYAGTASVSAILAALLGGALIVLALNVVASRRPKLSGKV
jgi:putative membrane protein